MYHVSGYKENVYCMDLGNLSIVIKPQHTENALYLITRFSSSSSSSDTVQGSRLAPHYRTLGDLEWEVESTTVTHSSADWWDLLLPLA